VCVSRKGQHIQWEERPTMEEARSHVAWVAGRRETKYLEPTDKAIFGMVSERSGRNIGERGGSLDRTEPGGRALTLWVKAGRTGKSGGSTCALRRGSRGSMAARMCRATGEALPIPGRDPRSMEGSITGEYSGNEPEGRRVADGSVVAVKVGNAPGAKGPCRPQFLSRHGRHG
jgi:hypothetical protein